MERVSVPPDLNDTEEVFPRQLRDRSPPIVGYRKRSDPFPWVVKGIGAILAFWGVLLFFALRR